MQRDLARWRSLASPRTKDIGKIFCIGLNRTGTTSLAVATSFLGFYTIHDTFEANLKIDRARHEGRRLLHYIDEYDAYTDVPFYKYYRPLYEQYPRSLFILTKRDPDSWMRSRMALDAAVARMLPNRVSDEPRMTDAAELLQFIDGHHRDVEDYFQGNPDFLSMDICAGDGWDKLCPFLGVAIPDRPFPRKHAFASPQHSADPADSAQPEKT